MILILMGKTASGKDSIAKELCRNYQFARIVTYTTRPPRPNEVDGEDYHFISRSEFQDKIKHNFFVEWKDYQSAEGEWFYGTAMEDVNKGGVLILTPLGIRDFYRNSCSIARVVYVRASDEVIMERLMQRGDNPIEAKRRLEHDHEDFDIPAVRRLADYEIVNEGRAISDITKEIFNYWTREKERIYGINKL